MASPADVCPVCLQNFHDPRVLPCLHSVCKACVDRMDVTADDGAVQCPICRAACRLPSGGAAALPTDVTVATMSSPNRHDECGAMRCRLCEDESSGKKPSAWCRKCRFALCDAHVGAHIIAAIARGEEHVIVGINVASPMTSTEVASSHREDSVALCPHHGDGLKFHCGTCDVAICGACTAVGDHRKHDNVRRIKDILEERKTSVASKVDTLERDVVGKLERSLQAVDSVSTELASRADGVRSEILQAGRRAVEVVEAQVEQMVAEVDDLEQSRSKVLDQQRDKLKSHLDAAKGAILFRDRIMRLDSGDEAQFSLLHALDARTTSLLATHIDERPQHHSRIMFKEASDADRACRAKESIGEVIPRQASATHSEMENGTTRKVQKGKTANITIRAKDRNGRSLTNGGDVISARFAGVSTNGGAPSTTITDNDNGSYTISCMCLSPGAFELEVRLNGQKMTRNVTITCTAFTSTFDPAESHPSIVISEDGQKASFSAQSSGHHCTVLGSFPMRSGQYTWKVKVGSNMNYHSLGVATKPLSSQRVNDQNGTAYCCFNERSRFVHDNATVDNNLGYWSPGDTFHLDLDCDRHTLCITSLSSQKTCTFTNLPDKEYFQFANLYQSGNSVEFVE